MFKLYTDKQVISMEYMGPYQIQATSVKGISFSVHIDNQAIQQFNMDKIDLSVLEITSQQGIEASN